MRRSEKIRKFLEEHPRATERELQKKFHLSFREAKLFFDEYYGVAADAPEAASVWRRATLFAVNFFNSEKKTPFFLFGLAALVRLGYILVLARHEELRLPLLDAEYYLEWADTIVKNGFLGDRVFFTEPFYAYLLAFILKLVGSAWLEMVTLGFQFLLGAFFPVLLYFVGRTLLSRPIGVVTGLLAALYGPFVFYEGLLLKTSLEVYSLPLFLLFCFKTFERPRPRSFFLLGLLLGIIALIKGNVMVFALVTVFLIFFFFKTLSWQTRSLFSGLFLAGVLVCIAPVTFRNYVVGHDIVPTNYSVGLVVYQGNWWNGDGSTALVPTFLRPHPKYEETDAVGMAEAYAEHTLQPSEVSRFWIGKAVQEILAAPGHFLATIWHKVLLLLNYREYSDNYSYAFYRSYMPFLWLLPGFSAVVVLGGAGLFLLFRRSFREMLVTDIEAELRFERVRLMLTLFFASYVSVLLMTTINSRYRMPLVPFLLLFSASLIVFCIHYFRERLTAGLGSVVLVMGLFLGMTVLPLSIFKHLSFADAYHNIGYWYYEAGDYARASEYFHKAIEDDDQYAWSYKTLARIALLEGRFADAETLLKKLIMIRPDDASNYEEITLLKEIQALPKTEVRAAMERRIKEKESEVIYDADAYEAARFLKAGDEAAAEAAFLRSLKKEANAPGTLLALASLKSKHEEYPLAKQYLRAAIAENPNFFPARYNLANIFIKENNFKEVADLLQPIYAFVPELGETWYNYAVALIKTNQTTEALPVIQAYIERYKDDVTRADKVKKFQDAIKPSDQSLNDMVKNLNKK